MRGVLISFMVLGAILMSIFIVLAISDAKRYSDANGPVWNDDDYDGHSSY